MNSKVLAPLFALLIFVAHLNCALEHRLCNALRTSSAANLHLDDSTEDGSPIADPLSQPQDDEDCEQGCICKGATLADHFGLTDFENSEWHFFFASLLSVNTQTTQPLFESVDLPANFVCCVPLRASDRCALLQSYLI